jgi:hypothetical protein
MMEGVQNYALHIDLLATRAGYRLGELAGYLLVASALRKAKEPDGAQ